MDRTMYSKNHMWVSYDKSDVCTLGLSEYALKKLGNIVFINLPSLEDILCENEIFGDVESIKTVSDLVSPVSGKVIEINEELLDNPEKLNEPGEKEWLVKIENVQTNEQLMNQDEYVRYVNQL